MTETVSNRSEPDSRQVLRDKLRGLRRNISKQQRTLFDTAIQQHLLTLIESRSIVSLAAFWPFDGEPDLLPALQQLERQGIQLALPVIRKTPASPSMIFRQFCIPAILLPI